MQEDQTVSSGIIEKVYPSVTDAEGFFFENKDEEENGIQTKVYENGNKVKKVILPASKKKAVVRDLMGKDTKLIARFMGDDKEKYQMAAVAVACTIDGQPQPIEVYETMKMKDFNILLAICSELNF